MLGQKGHGWCRKLASFWLEERPGELASWRHSDYLDPGLTLSIDTQLPDLISPGIAFSCPSLRLSLYTVFPGCLSKIVDFSRNQVEESFVINGIDRSKPNRFRTGSGETSHTGLMSNAASTFLNRDLRSDFPS